MKILLLNPHIDATHGIAKALLKKGIAILHPADATEAWQMLRLHGVSVELAVIHRESATGKGHTGIEFIDQVKQDPTQADLPIILTTAKWTDAECAEHQRTPGGANAYLHHPFTEFQLLSMIEAVTGKQLGMNAPEAQSSSFSQPSMSALSPSPAHSAAHAPGGMKLEEASVVLESTDGSEGEAGTFALDAPDLLTEGEIPQPQTQISIPTALSYNVSAEPTATATGDSSGVAGEMPALSLDSVDAVSLVSTATPQVASQVSSMDQSAIIVLEGQTGQIEPASLQPPARDLDPPTTFVHDPSATQSSTPLSLDSPSAIFSMGGEQDLSQDPPTQFVSSIDDSQASSASAPSAPSIVFKKPDLDAEQAGSDAASEPVTRYVSVADENEEAAAPDDSGPIAPPVRDHEPELTSLSKMGRARVQQDEEQLAQDLPYLFNRGTGGAGEPAPTFNGVSAGPGILPPSVFSQPLGDAVVPGGAAHSPDTDTLKKYLLLREQDVAALSAQLRNTRDQLNTVDGSLREEKSRNQDLQHVVEDQKRKIGDFEKEKAIALEGLQAEINELRFQMKAKVDKARLLEGEVREATEEMERLKERVRSDIRKIRVREKELENRLEIMKKDAEALIGARENKIIELKRRLDLIEFNMDLLQDKYSREKETSAKLRERLTKAAQAVRVAGGVLDPATLADLSQAQGEAQSSETPGKRAAS